MSEAQNRVWRGSMFTLKLSGFGVCLRRILGALAFLAMSGLAMSGWLVDPAFPSAGDDQASIAASLRSRIEAGGPISVHGLLLDRAALAAVYQARSFTPLWQDHPEWEPA